MRLSVVFELLLVFLFLAFASARVIDSAKGVKNVAKGNKKTTTLRQGPPNRYCACTSRMCNCCRDFSLPVVPLKGPGCASIMYVHRDTMMVTMSFGDRVLSNTTISGKSPKPICMALPGGISQFCGRIYGISRKGDQFRACLGLELRALDDIEAALRVSCFKFGPKGVRLESAPPVPVETDSKDPEEDDEDDYDLDDDEDDDIIGFGVDEDDGASSEDNEVDSDSVDYTGFSVLGEDILGTLFSDDSGSSTKKKKPSKKTAKPQIIVAPKVSSTTRRPILPNRRRSTVKPFVSVTKRPVFNRVTKRPTISPNRPQIIQKPSLPNTVSLQPTVQTTFLSVSPTVATKNDLDKNIITKSPPMTTEAPVTTTKIITTVYSQENEKIQIQEEALSQETTTISEKPITFTIPTQKAEVVKNDIKLPQTDLAKLEAVAAIAQQDVTSGVISSSSLMSEKTEKPLEKVTVKYEKITPTYLPEVTSSYMPINTEKISSIKFIPTTVVTSKPTAELEEDDDQSLDKIVESEIVTSSHPEIVKIKDEVIINPQSAESAQVDEDQKENIESSSEEEEQIDAGNIIEKNSINKKGNVTSLKKQSIKKPQKQKEQEEEDEEEEEEEEEDLLEGVLSDEDDTDNEEAENNEENVASQPLTNKNKNQANDNEEEEEDDDDDDILEETVETNEKVKPAKVSIKKKPSSDDADNEEEEEEEEEDILDVLDDDEEEESDNEEEDDESEKEKNKKKPSTEATTIKVKRPITQQHVQTQTKKPMITTAKVLVSSTPEEKTTEKITEKIFIYKEPIEKITEKVFIYQEPENQIPNKIFIYKEPENQITQKTTEKVFFYKEPVVQSVTEKFIIYKEPEKKITKKPVSDDIKSSEEIKDDVDEEEKIENDDENSSEEELEDDSSNKHTLVASIVKPGFSNKYAEEHDLSENDDIDIEDPEEDGSDFEDRKMKGIRKKSILKSPVSKKPEAQVSKPVVLTLSDLIDQHKKYHEHSKSEKPISTSRTHRRMNLDRLLQV